VLAHTLFSLLGESELFFLWVLELNLIKIWQLSRTGRGRKEHDAHCARL
jgi:hypothetical protein